jgi:hypothetical protein
LGNIPFKVPALIVNNLALQQKYLERSKIGIPLGEGSICQQEVVGLYNKRVGFCGILPVKLENNTINVVKSVSGNIHFAGMQYCGRNWLCPKCSFKIMKSRTGEIAKQFKKYRSEGEKIFFYTFTLQHNRWQSLQELLDILLGAYKYARSHRRYRQYVGKTRFIRTIEIKYGANGWHPHIHCSFVSKEENTGNDVFQELYENFLRKKGLLVNDYTVDGKEWDGTADELSEYLLKWELERELTGGNDKTGTGGLTFFEMVKFYHQYIKQVEEYIEATKGHKQYHFTGNFFDKAQKTDEEIVQEHEETKEILFEIPREEYGKMYYHNLTRRFIKWIKEKDPDYDKIKRTLQNKGINTDWLKVPG